MTATAEADIIILSWNRVEETIAAIQSAVAQVDVDKRVLIVDQGSTPTNLALLKEYVERVDGVELKCLERNVGVPAGRNIASAMGTARYIVALDSDAVFADEDTVARAVAHMDAHPELCAIGFQIANYFDGTNDYTSWDYPMERDPHERFRTTRFIGAGHAIRRTTFEAVGGYDETLFFFGEETDLCYRMLNTGKRIEYYPGAKVLHKISPEHRVSWDNGRFFYTVRNTLYTQYKFRTPLPRRVLAAAAFLVRGFSNSVLKDAARGVFASFTLCNGFQADNAHSDFYRLRPETWEYILECEPSRSESVFTKFRRQFVTLPRRA